MKYITVETEALNRLLRANKELVKRLEMAVDRMDRLMEVNRTLERATDFDWVDDQFVMEALNLSLYQLRRARKDGSLPYSVIGGKYFYRLKEALRSAEQTQLGIGNGMDSFK